MRSGIRHIEGTAIWLGLANIDTDTIIPAQFLKTCRRTGLGAHACASLRTDPANALDAALRRGASILIAGENFGCGSSREHAVWALLDLGIRAVIATSFSEIFAGNAFKNGLVAARLEPKFLPLLDAARDSSLCLDLAGLKIECAGKSIPFELDPFHRECLMSGLDEIGLTLGFEDKIAAFEKRWIPPVEIGPQAG